MAYSTTKIDINRTTTGVVLPPELSEEIFAKMPDNSAVMQLARRVPMAGRGEVVPMITADAAAAWTVESTEKQVSHATLNSKTMTPYKLAVIELFSNEFRRDLPRVYDELVARLPYSIGKKFDETVLTATAPGTGFDVLSGAAAVAIDQTSGGTVYQSMVSAFTSIGAAGYAADGWIMAPQALGALLSAVDGNGRPLFIDSIRDDNRIGRILGGDVISSRNVYKAGTSPTPNQVGMVGDWTTAYYGMVEPGITVAISEQATINDGTNQINLWQRNMFAVRVECELAFAVMDATAFNRLTLA